MNALTDLERAVLRSIGSETPRLATALERQVARAAVTGRKNGGAGFFTTMLVPGSVPPVGGPRVLGDETQARAAGLKDAMGFVLFMEDGRLSLLEGYVLGAGSTASLDFGSLDFDVFRTPVNRIG